MTESTFLKRRIGTSANETNSRNWAQMARVWATASATDIERVSVARTVSWTSANDSGTRVTSEVESP